MRESVPDMARGAPSPHARVMRLERDEEDDDEAKATLPDDAFLDRAAETLFARRTVLVFGEVTTKLARTVSAQLIALAASGAAPIRMFVHSQGGHVEAGDTIHDLVRAVAPEVVMIGTGWVASAGAHIYVAAKKENRYALPNTRFLLHQPLGGMSRQSASDIEIEANQIVQMRERLNRTMSRATGQDYETITRDSERNFWMNAQEASAYGLVHRVVESLSDVPG
jgi:ATP-dependent Clp protease, protease subunit